MTAHPAAGESFLQLPDELPERGPLCRSPGVCRASPAVQTTFIADAYRMSVEVFRMGSDAFEGTGEVACSILADVIMVACPVKPATPVHQVQSLR